MFFHPKRTKTEWVLKFLKKSFNSHFYTKMTTKVTLTNSSEENHGLSTVFENTNPLYRESNLKGDYCDQDFQEDTTLISGSGLFIGSGWKSHIFYWINYHFLTLNCHSDEPHLCSECLFLFRVDLIDCWLTFVKLSSPVCSSWVSRGATGGRRSSPTWASHGSQQSCGGSWAPPQSAPH